MAKIDNIKWGSYRQWEGPFYPGRVHFSLPQDPSDAEKILAVITATEGGCFDAINMYDSCILSSGLIQWCEAHYLVSSLLGAAANRDPALLDPLQPALAAAKASFKQRADGKWRFFEDGRGEVNTMARQQALFLGCSGLKGAWAPEAKARAALWAACVASVWENPEACSAQVKYTADRLGMFHTKDSMAILHGPGAPADNAGWVGAVRAAYLSFAANLPAVASEQLRLAVSQTNSAPWTEPWVIAILRQLTFGPKIAIYPARYEKIRPKLEALYGVDLPDFSHDLSEWHAEIELNTIPGMAPDFLEPAEVQEELIAEGFDLGPKGADGVYGPKTKQAIREFQQKHGLSADGVVGPNTRKVLLAEYTKRAS